MAALATLAVGTAGVSAPAARAEVLCSAKRSGVVKLREKCRKKEQPVDLPSLGAVGPTGPAGAGGAPGPKGADGMAVRAYALVDPTTPSLVTERTANFTAVSRGVTGEYCLTPAPGVDLDAGTAIAAPEFGLSSGGGLTAAVQFGQCPTGQLAVITQQNGSDSDNVAFVVIVP